MKYRNVKTGAVIDAYGIIRGDGWEEIPSSPVVSEKAEKPVKDTDEPAEEAPVEKKKVAPAQQSKKKTTRK